jgi:hypothetical protein
MKQALFDLGVTALTGSLMSMEISPSLNGRGKQMKEIRKSNTSALYILEWLWAPSVNLSGWAAALNHGSVVQTR